MTISRDNGRNTELQQILCGVERDDYYLLYGAVGYPRRSRTGVPRVKVHSKAGVVNGCPSLAYTILLS